MPTVWSRELSFDNCTNAVMRMLFLGAVKITLRLINDWTKTVGLGRGHSSFVNKRMSTLDSKGWLALGSF